MVVISDAIIGALVGGAVTFLIGEIRSYREENEQKEKLRQSLYHELDAIPEINRSTSPGSLEIASTVVYESNAGKLGMLSKNEIKPIVRFYSDYIGSKEFAIANWIGNDNQQFISSLPGHDTLEEKRKDAMRALEWEAEDNER